MTPEQMQSEIERLKRIVEDQARALREHAERESAERQRKESRARVNRQNYERRKAAQSAQTSESDRGQTLNQTTPPSPLVPPSLSPDPSLPSPLYPPFPPENAASRAAADAEPMVEDFALTSPTAGRKPRKPSKAEELYTLLQGSRKERCEQVGVPFVDDGWKPARMNRDLGALARLEEDSPEAARLNAAWAEYLADESRAGMDVPWSLGYFLASRSTWEGRAMKAGGAP